MRQSRVSVGSWRARLLLLAWPVGARRRWRRVVGDFAVLILEYRVAVAGIPVFEVTGFACLVHLVANLEQAVEVARLRDPHRCERSGPQSIGVLTRARGPSRSWLESAPAAARVRPADAACLPRRPAPSGAGSSAGSSTPRADSRRARPSASHRRRAASFR